MFLIGLLRNLLALPFALLGKALAMLKLSPAVRLLELAYIISRNGETGRFAVATHVKYQGVREACLRGQALARRFPSAELAATVGIFASENGDQALFKEMLDLAKSLDPALDNDMTLLLDTLMVIRDDSQATVVRLTQLDSRDDLSPIISKLISPVLIATEFTTGQAGRARQRALRMLAIENSEFAEMALAAHAEIAGDAAATQYYSSRSKLSESSKLNLRICAMKGIKQFAQAQQVIEQLREIDPAMADMQQRLLDQRQAI